MKRSFTSMRSDELGDENISDKEYQEAEPNIVNLNDNTYAMNTLKVEN